MQLPAKSCLKEERRAKSKGDNVNEKKFKELIQEVQEPWFWDFGNSVLYRLCKQHSGHSEASIATAKVWLIGRSYSAAIERRRPTESEPGNFYRDRVAPELIKSDLDNRLASLKKFRRIADGSLSEIIDTHKYVTDLFQRISGQNKRSLASKYLHFHVPELFFIYDSVANKGISKLSHFTGRASLRFEYEDNQYRKFVEKCISLRQHIHAHHDVLLTTRQLDRLLLSVGR